MDRDEILNQASELYEAKLRTGAYDGYDERARDILFDDCVRQVATTAEINRISEANRQAKSQTLGERLRPPPGRKQGAKRSGSRRREATNSICRRRCGNGNRKIGK